MCRCADHPYHTLRHIKLRIPGRSYLMRHSFTVCVWACLRWINSFSHVHFIPTSLPLSLCLCISGFSVLSSFHPPICPGSLFVWRVCFRFLLLSKHAPFSWVRFCHFVRAPGLTPSHTHTHQHMYKHIFQTSWNTIKRLWSIFLQQQWIIWPLLWKKLPVVMNPPKSAVLLFSIKLLRVFQLSVNLSRPPVLVHSLRFHQHWECPQQAAVFGDRALKVHWTWPAGTKQYTGKVNH